MKKMILATLLVALFMGLSEYAGAHPRHRQRNQVHRIKEGVRNGEITRHEARHLKKEQRHIASMKRNARADGHVSPRERARIARAEHRASKNIFYAKHNRHQRY
jgi:uncharacterized membrane protein YebE (DUF533 family)